MNGGASESSRRRQQLRPGIGPELIGRQEESIPHPDRSGNPGRSGAPRLRRFDHDHDRVLVVGHDGAKAAGRGVRRDGSTHLVLALACGEHRDEDAVLEIGVARHVVAERDQDPAAVG